MMNDPFSHEPPKPFHSNGYARVSQGNTMGSTNTQTFGQRVHVERNRTAVGRYGSSHIGQGHIHKNTMPRADTDGSADARPPITQRSVPRGHVASPPRAGNWRQQPRTSFREPPAKYNPYG